MGQRGGRLRSRLLVGVAAAALAVPPAHRAVAQQATPDKFQPHVEAGGLVTNDHGGGDVDFFLPLWQDPTSLLFADLRGQFTTESTQEGNFGLGYRTQIDPAWILGGYGFIDIQHSRQDNLFYQGSVGAELLSVDWDFRLNGYIPFNGDSATEKGSGGIGGTGLTIVGTDLALHTRQEKALFGVDGEVGWRLPIFPADGDVDVRAYAGGFWFGASDVDSLAGPRGRIEVRLYDLDLLGLQSRLTAEGLVQWDDRRGTIGGGGLELRIPLGGLLGDPATKLSPLDRRMVDRVVRDADIVTADAERTRSQDVRVDGLTVSTHKVVFVDATGTPAGSGRQTDPMDLGSAPGRFPGKNEIIIAQGDQGDLVLANPVRLQDGQALLGGGTPVGITLVGGPESGRHIAFTPPGSRPTVVGTDGTADLIELASGGQNRVTGLSLAGAFADGIHGLNLYRGIVTDNDIGGASGNGIWLAQTGAGAQPSSAVYIARNLVAGSASDGILVRNALSDGLGHTQLAAIVDNRVSGSGADGIAVSSTVSGPGTALAQGLLVAGNDASANGSDGFRLSNVALGGGSIGQGGAGVPLAAFLYNTAAFNGDDGFGLVAGASGAGSVLQQALLVRGNRVTSNTGEGILLVDVASAGSTLSQAVAIAFNTATGNGVDGIAIANAAIGAGASLTQQAVLFGNVATGNGGGGGGPLYRDGIVIANYGFGGGAVQQDLTAVGNTLGGNSAFGLALANVVEDGSSIRQTAYLGGNVAAANGSHGIYLLNRAGTISAPGTGGGTILQAVTGLSNVAVANAGDGVRLHNIAYFAGSVVSQSVALADSTIAGNGGNGIALIDDATGGGAIGQTVAIDPSTIEANGRNGIYGLNRLTSATLSQSLLILDNTIGANSSDAIRLVTPSAVASSISQGISVGGNIIAGNASNGLFVSARVVGGSVLSQSLQVADNLITGGSGSGVRAEALAASGGTVVQSFAASGNTIAQLGASGIYVHAYVNGGAGSSGTLLQSVSIASNSIADVGRYGVRVLGSQANGTGFTQAVTIAGNVVTGAGDSGISVEGTVNNGRTFSQSVLVAGNAITGVSESGISIISKMNAVSSAGVAAVEVVGNSITSAGIDGIAVAVALTNATLVETAFHIDSNAVALVGGAVSGGVGGIGIYVGNVLKAGGVLTQGVSGSPATIDGNSVSGAPSGGILVADKLSGAGASLSQVLVIDPNTIAHAGFLGIGIATALYAGAAAVQALSIGPNSISDVQAPGAAALGILVRNKVGDSSAGATLTQSLAITGNSVTGIGNAGPAPYAFGIALSNAAGQGATLSQAAILSGNQVTSLGAISWAAGIFVSAAIATGAAVSQSLSLAANTIQGVGATARAQGIYVFSSMAPSATLSQTIALRSNDVSFISGRAIGIVVDGVVRQGGSLSRAVTLQDNLVSAIGTTAGTGVLVEDQLQTGASAQDTVVLDGNIVAQAAGGGINVENVALSGASAIQTLTLTRNTVTDVARLGIGVTNIVYSAALSQTLALGSSGAGNLVSGASGPGIDLLAIATGGLLSQGGSIYGNLAVDNGGAGLQSMLFGQSGSGAQGTAAQVLTVQGNSLSGNSVGIAFGVSAQPNEVVSAGWVMSGNTIQNNSAAGASFGVNGTGATQTIDMSAGGNVITSNGPTRFFAYASGGTQSIGVFNGTSGNVMDGAVQQTAAGGATQVITAP
jgi:hypothetical protein